MKNTISRALAWASALAITVTMLACGNSPTDPTPGPSVGGPWEGAVEASTLTLLLYEVNGDVSGTAIMDYVTGPNATFDVQGTQVGQDVSLTIAATGYHPFTLSGAVSSTQINGVLNGSGWVNDPVTLAKCPCP